MTQEHNIKAQAAALSPVSSDGTLPEWIQLTNADHLDCRDGRRFSIPDANQLVKASLAYARTEDVAIDYDHQADYAEFNGQPAPAAGWIKELEARPDGIWGRVEWTPKAAEHIKNKEYRYISPSFYRTKAGVVTCIYGAALTNRPALSMKALANAQPTQTTENEMDETLKALLSAMNLPEDTSADKAMALVKELASAKEKATSALGLKKEATVSDMEKALTETLSAKAPQQPDPSKYVPMAAFDEMSKELASVQKSLKEDKAASAVAAAKKAGKLSPAMEQWGKELASSDPEAFAAYVASAPSLSGESTASGEPSGDKPSSLTDAEKETCRALGIEAADFLKNKAEEKGES